MGGLDATAMQWVLLFVAATTALLAFFFSTTSKQKQKKLRLPPGPAGLPVFGNLGIFVTSSHPHQELDRLSKKYGPLMSLRMGSKQALVVSAPEMAKEVLKTFDKEFANRPKITAKDALGYGDYTIGFASYGPVWRFARKIATLELLTLKRTQQFQGVREEEFSAMLRSVFEDSQKSGPAVDMNQRTTYLIMNIMTRVIMNKRFYSYNKEDVTPSAAGQQPAQKKARHEEELAAEFKELMEQGFFLSGVSIIGDVIPYLGFLDRIMNYKAAMQKVHSRYDSFLGGVVEEHRQHQQQSDDNSERDFVDILLSLPGEDGVGHIDEALIKGLLTDMLNAGTDSSSITIEWGLSELLRHPHIMQKLQTELDSVVGKHRVVAESDIPNLPYLRALVKEVFRLHPPGPLLIPHESTQACQVGGYDIPAGTVTFVNVWSIGRNGATWDQPLEFNPERFVDRDTDVRGQHYELLPFGSGRRGCPGMHLALAMVHYGLARLAHSFDWRLPEGQDPQHLDMTEKFGLALPRATPLLAVPSPRLPPYLY